MGLVQTYQTINDLVVTTTKTKVIASGSSGILLGFEVVWWGRVLEIDTGLLYDAPVYFYINDGAGNEQLGTNSTTAQLISVSKKRANWVWLHPNASSLLFGADWFCNSIAPSASYVGKFQNGMTMRAIGETAIPSHISFQALFLEFD